MTWSNATAARRAWAGIVTHTKRVYVDALGFGHRPHIRGHWADRLPAIDQDLAYMEKLLRDRESDPPAKLDGLSQAAVVWLKPRPVCPPCEHHAPTTYRRSHPLDIVLTSKSPEVHAVKLYYRHVNQVEAYQVQTMTGKDGDWRGTIGDDYTDSRYPVMYYFELHDGHGHAWLYPGFEPDLANQPYYHVRHRNG